MSLEASSTSVVLDNALLFSAANFFNRQNSNQFVRGVNLLGLAALADALVMHDRITIDRAGWEYFLAAVPVQWQPAIEPMADILTFDFPDQKDIVEALFKTDSGTLLCYATAVIDDIVLTAEEDPLKNIYFAYTGSDLSPDWRNEQTLISQISDLLPNIPNIHFYLRSYEHVSGLQSLVRALQYEYVAGDLGRPFLPHDYRGRMLNIVARSQADPSFRGLWAKFISTVRERIELDYSERLSWTLCSDSSLIWDRVQKPVFLAMAMQRAKTLEDLFSYVRDIRDRAMPLRRLFDEFSDPTSTNKARIAQELKSVAFEMAKSEPDHARSTISLSAGLPASFSLGIDLPKRSKFQSISFIRDIYDNHSLPSTLGHDFERLFGTRIQGLTHKTLDKISPAENVVDFAMNRLSGVGLIK